MSSCYFGGLLLFVIVNFWVMLRGGEEFKNLWPRPVVIRFGVARS